MNNKKKLLDSLNNKEKKSVLTSVRVPTEVYAWVAALAEKTGHTKAKILQCIICEFVEGMKK